MIVFIINMRKHGHAAANSSAVHVTQVTPNKMEQAHEMQYQQPHYEQSPYQQPQPISHPQ
jgi:hypothetical protein